MDSPTTFNLRHAAVVKAEVFLLDIAMYDRPFTTPRSGAETHTVFCVSGGVKCLGRRESGCLNRHMRVLSIAVPQRCLGSY